MTRLRNLIERIRSLQSVHWVWIVAALIAGFIAFYFDSTDSKKTPTQKIETPESAATSIPPGFVLVPIEVANFESLDSILGKFGVVDLYLPSEDSKKRAMKIASHLKILRAPLNPSHFAVLARESESGHLVAHAGPFTVIVQNPQSRGTEFVKPSESDEKKDPSARVRNSRITVEVLDDREG